MPLTDQIQITDNNVKGYTRRTAISTKCTTFLFGRNMVRNADQAIINIRKVHDTFGANRIKMEKKGHTH